MNIFKPVAFAATLGAAVWFAWPATSPRESHAPATAKKTREPVETEARSNPLDSIATSVGGMASPFGRGQPPTPPTREMTVAVLRATLKEVKLRTPERYYSMGYKTLRNLAGNGDIYANIQLATQYAFAADALERDPDYDATLNPQREAFKLFRNAALMGNNSAMVMLSTRLAGTDPVEAYSWKLVADRLTNEGQLEFYTRNKYGFQLSASEMAKAQQRAQELIQEMASRPPVVFPAD